MEGSVEIHRSEVKIGANNIITSPNWYSVGVGNKRKTEISKREDTT